MSTVDYSLYLSYVGLPASVGLSVGVGNVATEGYALSANFTLCHYETPPKMDLRLSHEYSHNMIIISHSVTFCKCFLYFFQFV